MTALRSRAAERELDDAPDTGAQVRDRRAQVRQAHVLPGFAAVEDAFLADRGYELRAGRVRAPGAVRSGARARRRSGLVTGGGSLMRTGLYRFPC